MLGSPSAELSSVVAKSNQQEAALDVNIPGGKPALGSRVTFLRGRLQGKVGKVTSLERTGGFATFAGKQGVFFFTWDDVKAAG